MTATLKRGLGTVGATGFAGMIVFLLVGVFEILTGHGSDPVPSAWLDEAAISFAMTVLGGLGWIITDLVSG